MIAQPTDTVLLNGKIVTVDANFRIAEAVAVRGDRLLAVGANAEVLAAAAPDARRIDLGGRTVLPGLIDAHPHVDSPMRRHPSLADCTSVQDIKERVGAWVERAKPGEWIIFRRVADPEPRAPNNLREGRFPNRFDLDDVAPNNPVWIRGNYITPSIVNSRALELGGINRDTPQPQRGVPAYDGRTGDYNPSPGGHIEKDPNSGEPTGILHDYDTLLDRPATAPLWRLTARPTYQQRLDTIRGSLREFNAVGTTAAYEGHGLSDPVEETHRAYLELHTRHELSVRSWVLSNVYTHGSSDDVLRRIDALGHTAHRGAGDDTLRFQGVTVTLDGPGGAFDSVQPKISTWPGPNDAIRDGVARVPREKFQLVAREAARRGLRLATKAGGEPMIDWVIEVFGEQDAEFGIADRRWVLMHCQFVHPRQMPRLKALGVTPTTCSSFLWNHGQSFINAYGAEVANRAVPMRSWLDAGLPITNGCDTFPISPFWGMWLMATRTDGETGRRLDTAEAITREAALLTYTRHGAYLLGLEDHLGSIEPGKYADLVVCSADYLTAPEATLRDITATLTMVAGRVVHDTGALGDG